MIRDVVTLDVKATVKEAVKLMSQREIGCLVIVQNDIPIGIVTEGDMLTRVLLDAKDTDETKVYQIMSAPLIFGSPHMKVHDAVRLMAEKNIKKLPIVERQKLVGMMTFTDLARSKAYLEHIITRSHNNMVVQSQ